jgi:hypothetical protein
VLFARRLYKSFGVKGLNEPPSSDVWDRVYSLLKYEAIPVHDWTGHWGSQMAQEGDKFVSPTHRPPLPPRRYQWYLFLLEAESTPGLIVGWKDQLNEKCDPIENPIYRLVAQCRNQLHHQSNLPACSAVPQPTAPPCRPVTVSF